MNKRPIVVFAVIFRDMFMELHKIVRVTILQRKAWLMEDDQIQRTKDQGSSVENVMVLDQQTV